MRYLVWAVLLAVSSLSLGAHAETEIVVNLALDGREKPGIYVMVDGYRARWYPVAAPRYTPSCIRNGGEVVGTVTVVDHHATWRPTEKTKATKRARGIFLDNSYGPHDRRNALTGRRIKIDWYNACFDNTVWIHGTYDTSLVEEGARVSRGCIRMIPADWDELSTFVQFGTLVRMVGSFRP